MNVRVACVIMAAGAGRRFDRAVNKLTVRIGPKPLLQYAIDAATASHAMSCTMVVGAAREQILTCVDTRRCSIVENRNWNEGLASSLRTGLLAHLNDEACIFILGDQPFIQTADIDRLIRAFTQARNAIVALRAGAVWGAPILFPRADFGRLLRLAGDHGAKQYAERQRKRLRFVEAADQRAFSDIDVAADYQKLVGSALKAERGNSETRPSRLR